MAPPVAAPPVEVAQTGPPVTQVAAAKVPPGTLAAPVAKAPVESAARPTSPVVEPPVRVAMATPSGSGGDWTPPTRLDAESLAPRAAAGKLSGDDRALLEGIASSHPDFSRAKVWLYDDATARGVLADRKRHIDALMKSEEHQSNPVFLTEAAQVALAYKDFEGALAYARKAEQHWARLPSSAVFKRKAMIYEQQGASWYGIFVRSDATDMDALHQSIRAWQRYRQHVQERDAGLTERADVQLSKLTDIQARVE
jgi:hypothetical protein